MGDPALRAAIDTGDVDTVRAILTSHPERLREPVGWSDGRCSYNSSDLMSYICLARFHGLAEHEGMAQIATLLLQLGAPVEGEPGAVETPLISAVSYFELGIVRVLIDAGANLEARGAAAPGGTPLAHAAYFGNPQAADLLVSAGAQVNTLAEAAAAGDLTGHLTDHASEVDRAWALRAAAVCERPEIIDRLLAVGTDIDATTEEGGTALHWAAWHGKLAGVQHLIERGADPEARDPVHSSTPLVWCQVRHGDLFRPSPGHEAVQRYLEGLAAVGSVS